MARGHHERARSGYSISPALSGIFNIREFDAPVFGVCRPFHIRHWLAARHCRQPWCVVEDAGVWSHWSQPFGGV